MEQRRHPNPLTTRFTGLFPWIEALPNADEKPGDVKESLLEPMQKILAGRARVLYTLRP